MRQFNHLGQNQIAMKKLFCQILGLLLISGGIYFALLKPTFAADNSTRQLLKELDLSKNDVRRIEKAIEDLREYETAEGDIYRVDCVILENPDADELPDETEHRISDTDEE